MKTKTIAISWTDLVMGSLESFKNPNPMAQTMSIMLNVYGQNLRGCKPSDW